MTNVILSAQSTFKTIAEAAMLAHLPEAYKEDLRQQIVGFSKWVDSILEIEKKCEQLELDLTKKEDEQ